jgi:hypothetical protein
MAELFPQDTASSTARGRSRTPLPFDSLIRADGVRRGPVQPTTEDEPAADWASSPLYRAPETVER